MTPLLLLLSNASCGFECRLDSIAFYGFQNLTCYGAVCS